jgi:hypothetical protein
LVNFVASTLMKGTPLDVVAIKIGAGEALVGDAGIDRFVDKMLSVTVVHVR